MADQAQIDNSAFWESVQNVTKDVYQKFQDPAEAKSFMSDLMTLAKTDPKEFGKTIASISDHSKIQEVQAKDPSFSGSAAFIRSAANVPTLGLASIGAGAINGLYEGVKKAGADELSLMRNGVAAPSDVMDAINTVGAGIGQGIADYRERDRLLGQAYPAQTVAGGIAGLYGASKAAEAVGAKDAIANRVFEGGAAFGEKAVASIIKKIGGESAFATKALEVMGQFVPKATIQGGAGTAAFSGAQELINASADAVTGKDSVSNIPSRVVGATEHGGMLGAATGFGVSASLYGGVKVAEVGTKAVKSGMEFVGKNMLGKDVRYALDNVAVMKGVLAKGPDYVIAEAAEKVAPTIRKMQDDLTSIEIQAKQEITQAVGDRVFQLKGELGQTADAINKAATNLKNGLVSETIENAKLLHKEVDGSYSAINAKYGKDLTAAIGDKTVMANSGGTLDYLQNVLQKNGAMDRAGRILKESPWMTNQEKNYPGFSDQLDQLWTRLGGGVRSQGGAAASNINISDFMQMKQEIGKSAAFGTQKNNAQRIFTDLYFKMSGAAEVAVPELKAINKAYTESRGVLDDFRIQLGKTENSIATRIQRNLQDPKWTLTRDALEAVGKISENTDQIVGKTMGVNERLHSIANFKKDPRATFTQVQQAYVNGDQFMIQGFENLANKFPELKPYIEAAKRQGALVKNIKELPTVSDAMRDPVSGGQLSQAIPAAGDAIERARQAQIQSQQLGQVFPQGAIPMEGRLSQPGFGASPLEQKVVGQVVQENPALANQLEQAQAARVANRLNSGQIEKTGFENIPVIGTAIHALRSVVTPSAQTLLKFASEGSPKVRRAILGDVLENVQGVQGLSKEQVAAMRQQVGTEATVAAMAHQPGGLEDLAQATERASKQAKQ